MKVKKKIELGNGHKIEFGESTWNTHAISVRNRYPNKKGGFSPRSSSEIPIEDVKLIVEESVKNGYISELQMIEIAEICLQKLKIKSDPDNALSKQNKMDLMKQALTDKLFLSDLAEITDDFTAVDSENI
jgi:hypothetical protein